MFYYICAIVVGILFFVNTIINYKKISLKLSRILSLLSSIGLVLAGVIGFFIPKELDFIIIIILLVLTLGYVAYYYFLNKSQKAKTKK